MPPSPRPDQRAPAPPQRRYERPKTAEDWANIRRAKAHISAFKSFDARTMGVIGLVQAYLYELKGPRLHRFIAEYRARYGDEAADYATETIPRWASGAVHMSGMVAKRLFDLIPSFMSPSERLHIFDTLWARCRPTHCVWLTWGPGVDPVVLEQQLRGHLADTVHPHEIPKTLKVEFMWLTRGDAMLEEQLLNRYQHLEHERITGMIRDTAAIVSEAAARACGQPESDDLAMRIGGTSMSVASEPAGPRGIDLHFSKRIEVAGLVLHLEFRPEEPDRLRVGPTPPPPRRPAGRITPTSRMKSEGSGCLVAIVIMFVGLVSILVAGQV